MVISFGRNGFLIRSVFFSQVLPAFGSKSRNKKVGQAGWFDLIRLGKGQNRPWPLILHMLIWISEFLKGLILFEHTCLQCLSSLADIPSAAINIITSKDIPWQSSDLSFTLQLANCLNIRSSNFAKHVGSISEAFLHTEVFFFVFMEIVTKIETIQRVIFK